ncbi:MAG: hypothetical protein L6R40_003124 [Gallowayella cf. fulva]|nr:MAG: hypothetical protein L6R40_003124 [Xanthomendoza cf. fulva]
MPRKDPLLGLDITLDSYSNIKNHTYLQRCQERFLQHGTTFKSNSLGANAIYTIDPDNVKTVLAGKFEDYRLGQRREDAFVPLIGHGIFTADGEGWKHSRRLLHPSFTRRQVGDLDVYERHLMNLIRLIPQDGSSTVDLQRLFFDFTMDTGTEIFCGQSSFCLAPEKQGPMSTNFAHAFNQSQRTIADGVALGPLAFATHTPSFNKDRDTVHEFIDHFVRGALDMQSHIESSTSQGSEDESKKQESFLARLAQQVKDPICLRGELLNVMIAGRDTTASLLSNLWFVLANRPDIWTKLQEEIGFLGGQAPTLEQLKNLTYLRHCVNESLRLHPPIPVNFRTSVRDTTLPFGGGTDGASPVFVAAGTMVYYHVYSMHRLEKFYGPDAADFKPERWETIRPGWAFLPFNGGPRICLGQQLALTEATYVSVRLLQSFSKIQSRDPEPWHEELTISCSSQNGTQLGFKQTSQHPIDDLKQPSPRSPESPFIGQPRWPSHALIVTLTGGLGL